MLRTVASSLQWPVVALLLILVGVSIIMIGMLIAELFTERRQFNVSLPRLVDDIQERQDTESVIKRAALLKRQKEALLELLRHPKVPNSVRESLAVEMVTEEQTHFENRVKITDLIAKVAPMLGLMGTLIPLGPGLIAIGQGDTEILSQSLLIAFDTTILGLIVSAVALTISTIRKQWYKRYMAAFEAAAECVIEKASQGATAAPVAENEASND